MVRRIAAELDMPLTDIKVIATGGLAELIHANSETIQKVDQMLTLQGLRILYNKNKKMRRREEKGDV